MTKTVKTLTGWIRRQVYQERSDGKCVKLVMYHVAPTQKLGSEVFSVNIGDGLSPGEKVEDGAIDTYAADIVGEAESYTDGIGDTQSFIVAAIFENDPDKIVSRHAFRCRREGEDGETVGSEPATPTGLTAQLMRHTEAIMRSNGAMFGQAITTLVKQNAILSDMCEKFLETRVHELEAVEEMVSAKHSRDIEIKSEERKTEHQSKMVEHALALLPAVANKIVGKKILPETTDSSLMALVKLAETLTAPQIEAMSSVMEPAQRIAFFELLQSIQEKQAETRAANANGQAS